MGINPADYRAALVRLAKQNPQLAVPGDAVEEESGLQRDIMAYCDGRGWPYVYSRMDKKTRTNNGCPDFLICATGGRMLIVECKSRAGKLRPEQIAFKVMAEIQGHTVHIIRSMREFLEICVA